MPNIDSVTFQYGSPPTMLKVVAIPASTRLVLLFGPNGGGKSTILEAIALGANRNHPSAVIGLHGVHSDAFPVYGRTAYRAEQQFRLNDQQLLSQARGPTPRGAAPQSKVQFDARVSQNYQYIVQLATVRSQQSTQTWGEVAEALLSPVRTRIAQLFPGLEALPIPLPLGTPHHQHPGCFQFRRRGAIFEFTNLSGGEKEAFDIILDLELWRSEFPDAVYCIDEPELHLHTELQAALMNNLMEFLPIGSQLWIATHSIGIIKMALDSWLRRNDEIVFLYFEPSPEPERTIRPSKVDRQLWKRSFTTALHDLASLVAPATVVICEGRSGAIKQGRKENAEFDAEIYSCIFEESHPDTDFVAGGACNDIVHDSMKLASALDSIIPGTRVIRIIDRDCDRSPNETQSLEGKGFRILSRREIENYLWCDEILQKLCLQNNNGGAFEAIKACKNRLLGRQPADAEDWCDDVKAASGQLFLKVKEVLGLRESGTTPNSFALHALAALITPETEAYRALNADIFD